MTVIYLEGLILKKIFQLHDQQYIMLVNLSRESHCSQAVLLLIISRKSVDGVTGPVRLCATPML